MQKWIKKAIKSEKSNKSFELKQENGWISFNPCEKQIREKGGFLVEKQESIQYIVRLMEKQEKLKQLNQTTADTTLALDKAQKALEMYQIRIQEELERIVKKQRNNLLGKLEREVQSAQRKAEQAERQRIHEKNRQKKTQIADATVNYRKQIHFLRDEIKRNLREAKIPAFCRRKLWFSLFMPAFWGEYFLLLLLGAAVILGIPILLYSLIPNHRIWHFYLLFPPFVVISIVLYLKIRQMAFGKHYEVLKKCRNQMNEIHELQGRIRKTERFIEKNEDENWYELTEMDEKVKQAYQRLEQAKEKRKTGIQEFEQKTRQEIVKDFREKSKEKLEELTQAMNELSKEKNLSMELAAELHLELIDDYESRLGEENMNPVRLEQILQKLENGSADTLEDALKV